MGSADDSKPVDIDSDSDGGLELFTEPEGFRPRTPPPTETTYTLPPISDGSKAVIHLNLVGSHPLWGHHLWNAAPTLSNYLCELGGFCQGKAVLELGAAAGLPSIVASRLGANVVVTTDYPDHDLIENLAKNLQKNLLVSGNSQPTIVTEGYIWGADTSKLLSHLPTPQQHFDLVLLSDLIFNHQAHEAMLNTLDRTLPQQFRGPSEREGSLYKGPQALVFFTHHRPHLAHRDLEFFTLAEKKGWNCVQIGKWKMAVSFNRGTCHQF